MRELDRIPHSLAIVGAGRLGAALAAALRASGLVIDGPLGRGARPEGVDAVLLCVPDGAIGAAAAAIPPGVPVGHCSGATGLDALTGHEAFAFHPLMTVPADGKPEFAGAGAAIAGSTPRALAVAQELAARLGMRATTVADEDRAAYHAAASIASNYLVTLEGAAERLAGTAGVDRALLAPLVRAAVENWAPAGRGGRAHRPDRARRRSDGGAPARGRRGAHARPAGAVRRDGRRDTRAGGERGMRTLRTIAEVRAYVTRARGQGRSIGLVPTMGAFHDGHESLIRAARAACDEVIVSLFVNPTQFNEPSDLDGYPRDGDGRCRDRRGTRRRRVVRPAGGGDLSRRASRRRVRVAGLSAVLEGAERGPGHFDGVCTVVCKLFNIVAPDVAFFGQKDAQQVVVIGRMVRDLEIPVRLEIVPTVREPDGLALSSRNARLDATERERATALRRGLDAVRAAVEAGAPDPAEAGRAAMRAAGVEPEYLALVDPDTLEPVARVDGRVLAVVAARVGPARLIDNDLIETEQVATRV